MQYGLTEKFVEPDQLVRAGRNFIYNKKDLVRGLFVYETY